MTLFNSTSAPTTEDRQRWFGRGFVILAVLLFAAAVGIESHVDLAGFALALASVASVGVGLFFLNRSAPPDAAPRPQGPANILIGLGLLMLVAGYASFSILGAVLMLAGLISLVPGLVYRFVPGATGRTVIMALAAVAFLLSMSFWDRIPDLF